MSEKYSSIADEIIAEEKLQSLSHKLNMTLNDSTTSSSDRNSSLQTIFTISNGMVGSAAIVLPVLYFNYGIINALVIQFIICVISCKTTTLLIDHNLQSEMDLPDTLSRVLGEKWKVLFNIVSVFFLFACSLINIILIIQLIYPIIQILAKNMKIQSESQDQFSLVSLSFQTTGIVYVVCIFPFFMLKKIGPLLKLLSYGAVSICTCILFITIKGIINLAEADQIVKQNLKYSSNQYATLAGVFSLAFLGQSMIIPISKTNRLQTNNKRDTQIAFLWTFIVYSLIGVFGSIALTTQSQRAGTSGTTMLDFYGTDDYLAISIQIMMFLQLSTAFPVLQWITRSRFFGLFETTYFYQPSKKAFIGFSLVFAFLCLAIQMMNTNLSFLISFSGFLNSFNKYHQSFCGILYGIFYSNCSSSKMQIQFFSKGNNYGYITSFLKCWMQTLNQKDQTNKVINIYYLHVDWFPNSDKLNYDIIGMILELKYQLYIIFSYHLLLLKIKITNMI